MKPLKKPETHIKKNIESILLEQGLKDLEDITPTSHIFMVAPNRWGYGYIVLSHQGQIWSADFTKDGKPRTPKRQEEFWLASRGYFTATGWR